MVGYIYLITDTTNGKKYVGQHHYDKEELDPNYHGSGHIIRLIYNKRPETLKEEYLKTCFTQTEMDEWEKYFIFTNDTLYPNGYNLREGGNGKEFSVESRKKMSEKRKGKSPTNKGIPLSDERKSEISEKMKGKFSGDRHPMYGKHHTEESKKKISDSLKKIMTVDFRKKISESHKGQHNISQSKKVLQFTKDGEFVCEWSSTMEAGRKLNCSFSNIAMCCRGERKTAKGYIWKYKD